MSVCNNNMKQSSSSAFQRILFIGLVYPNALLLMLFLSEVASAANHNNRGSIRSLIDEQSSTNFTEPTALPETPEICGPNGFRCLDDETFQVCRHVDIDGQKEEPLEEHKCSPNMICDEENISYCSPKFAIIDLNTNNRPTGSRGNCFGFEDKLKKRQALMDNRSTSSYRHLRKLSDEFVCKNYGLFPDPTNESKFWFCDKGTGEHLYQKRHMLCAQARVFDRDLKQCVLRKPVPRPEREKPNDLQSTVKSKKEFTCAGRVSGKYSDATDCQKYILCLATSTKGNGFNQVVFMCPEGTYYDAQQQLCDQGTSCKHIADDMDNDMDDEPCEPGARMKDAGSGGGSYTLCVGKTSIAMRCPQKHVFDEKMLVCKPETMSSAC